MTAGAMALTRILFPASMLPARVGNVCSSWRTILLKNCSSLGLRLSGSFALPLTFPLALIGRASLLASRIPGERRFFSRIKI
jgi:hypothetical protein